MDWTGKAKTALRILKKIPAVLYKTATQKMLFPLVYALEAKRKPLREKKVVFLEMRMQTLTDSLQPIYAELEKRGGYELAVCSIGKEMVSFFRQFGNSLAALREMAAAKYIFLDDSSALISCIRPRKGVKIIQTWHACGAFKKFGFSTADKKFGGTYWDLIHFPMHRNFTYMTVSSPEVVWAYAEAFHMEDRREAIVPVGISRTDIFYDDGAIRAAREKMRRLLPQTERKKVILYAPTFRGRVTEASSPDELDLAAMRKALGDGYVLVCKHHPFVKNRPVIPADLADFAVDLTEEMTIEELLMVSEICISDYSSLVFEFSLFERPMIFFAYDLEDYCDWRGFYYDYGQMTPGPTCRTTQEIIDYIRNIDALFDWQRVADFRRKFMSACDGHATERILALMDQSGPADRRSVSQKVSG